MDETWRTIMEMPSTNTTTKLHRPHQRSTEDISQLRRTISIESDTLLLKPEDFNDVFGGPPRTVSMLQQFSRSPFYEEIFRQPEKVGPEGSVPGSGRVLQEFNIPAGRDGRKSDQKFFSYIFGWGKEEVRRLRTRSRSKSKGSSPSVLSSEDLSPLQTAVGGGRHGGDDEVSIFASRVRPINVPSRWNSTSMEHEEHQRKQDIPEFSWNNPSYHAENDYNENFGSSHFGYRPRNSSPETISLDPNSHCSSKVSADDLEPSSSPSAVSSICQDQEAVAGKVQDEIMQEQGMDEEEEEEEVMSSYVIEIDSGNKEGTDDAIGVEEAIAWAKEKYQKYCSENMCSMKLDEEKQSAEAEEIVDGDETLEWQKIDEHGSTEAEMNWEPDVFTTEEETGQMERDIEMDLLDENVRLWSTGKEADIRLLLSTLHHLLWPYGGWSEIPLTSLTESSQLKKAYQKARLCLHPDKLQQRGATLPQTYVAEKAFLILQEAWAAFISQDVS